MMPMQMRRKARKIEKVENSPALQPRGISCQHAGTNQITLARFGGRIFSQPMPPCSSATRAAQALIGAAIAIDLVVRDRDPAGDRSLAGYESFRRRIL
jgi:hypothetical protein